MSQEARVCWGIGGIVVAAEIVVVGCKVVVAAVDTVCYYRFDC